MKIWPTIAIAAMILAAAPDPAAAQGKSRAGCLSQREAIAAVQSGKAIPLSDVRATAEAAGRGEVIDADLCTSNGRLAYILTLLGANGQVTTATVDAANGRLIDSR